MYDKRDTQMPDVGLIRLTDLESGDSKWIDTSSKSVRTRYDKWWYERQNKMFETMMKSRVNFTSIATDEDYVKALMALFKNRGVK